MTPPAVVSNVAARRRCGAGDGARARYPIVTVRKSINFKPPGRVSCPAEQRLRPSLQRWRSERMAIRRSQLWILRLLAARRRCAVRCARCARYLTVAARKSINFRPPGRVSCPAEQRLRPSLQRWQSEQMAIGRSQLLTIQPRAPNLEKLLTPQRKGRFFLTEESPCF